jgi:hypothetical protein
VNVSLVFQNSIDCFGLNGRPRNDFSIEHF